MDVREKEKDKRKSGWGKRNKRETENEMMLLLDVYINTSLCSILLIATSTLSCGFYSLSIFLETRTSMNEIERFKSRHKILMASYLCHRSLINGLQSKAVQNCRTCRLFYINWPHLTITPSSPCEFLLPYIQTKWSEVQMVRFWQIYEKIVISFTNIWY